MDIHNESELQIIMERAATQALQNATKEILDLFKESYIRKYVYDSHQKNVSYPDGSGKPTMQFESSWEWTAIKKQVLMLTTEMWYNPVNMEHDISTYLHGSRYSKPNDVRENLPAILEGKQSSLWLSVSRPVKFFEKFISDAFNNGLLDKILSKHFALVGFIRT